ncbi:MAG: alanine--tRNA ligase-related protein, partial [Anaplasmataceae bacterium]|nr:alanine--tRNA ligase-related protein [Anaplasmataceae bacterium]
YNKNIVDLEESSFKKTIDKGYYLIDEYLATHDKKSKLVDGKTVFKLYDTYGFPIDLTQLIFVEHGLIIDEDGFNQCMAKQREMARKSWLGSGETKDHEIYFSILNENEIGDFLGYHQHECQALVVAIVKTNKIIEEATIGMTIELVLSQTVFYGESGGQKGDIGTAINKNCVLEIYDTTKKVGKLHVHHAKIISGILNKETILDLKIDSNYRRGLEAGHSATHLLNDGLIKIIGSHITQQGSMINDKYFTFDFNHHKPISNEQLNELEAYINKEIMLGHEMKENFMNYSEAIKTGAIALPGETYSKKVRVIEIGKSLALCGGTHIKNSAMIGFVKITSETSIAAGIRRITVYTGQNALNYLNDKIYNLEDKIKLLEDKNKKSKQEYSKEIENLYTELYKKINYETHLIKENNFDCKHLPDGISLNILRNLSLNDDKYKLILISKNDDKTSIVIKSDDKTLSANQLFKAIKDIKGGGNEKLAQGTCSSIVNFNDIAHDINKKTLNS